MFNKPGNAEVRRFQVHCYQIAEESGAGSITPLVMAVTVFSSGPNTATKVLDEMRVNISALQSELSETLKTSSKGKKRRAISDIPISEGGKEVNLIAMEVCELMGDPTVGVHHVLMAIMKTNAVIGKTFLKYGITPQKFRVAIKGSLFVEPKNEKPAAEQDSDKKEKVADGNSAANGKQSSGQQNQPVNEKEILSKYFRNLTTMASQGKLDVVIGREKEISRIVTTLSRRKKNNAILVGDPGVGKTAIVEGLAQRIVSGSVPTEMKDSQVFQLSMAAVVGKTTYRGQFEDRMKMIMDIFAAHKNYILFVDEMHTLVGAGGSVGGLDAANIMKPALASGDVRCIGATTEDEYRRYFKKDGALDRRFQRVFVDEPTKEEAVKILMGVKKAIELHHSCVVTEEIVRHAVDLSSRYVTDRHLPDKAIDCLDEACANAASKTNGRKKGEYITITKSDVVGAIANQTDMPEDVVGVSDANRAKGLSSFLKSKVVGQDKAVDTISSMLLVSYAGIRDPKKPIGCFVLGGPSGSGTTFMAEKLSEGLFESDSSLIRISMSEFSEKFGNTRLIGSPPGYVGYGDKNQLTDKVSRKPYSLILLDGIESAGEDVIRLFMQAMSKGVMTDAAGKEVSFRNAVIVMTMTFDPSSGKHSGLGFNDGTSHSNLEVDSNRRDSLVKACRDRFGDDFVNRVDDFVVFSELGKPDIIRVVELKIDELCSRVSEIGLQLTYTRKAIERIAEDASSCGKVANVKTIDRHVKRKVETILSTAMSEMDAGQNKFSIDVTEDGLECIPCHSMIEVN